MARRSADRAHWLRIVERRFVVRPLDTPGFRGYATLLMMDRVAEPWSITTPAGPLCLVDDGFSWLQHFPDGANYSLTTAFDARGAVCQWYVDICRGVGCDEVGTPWWNDLYLDIVQTPGGDPELRDADELDDALSAGLITPDDHALAWREAERLISMIRDGRFSLLTEVAHHRELLLAELASCVESYRSATK